MDKTVSNAPVQWSYCIVGARCAQIWLSLLHIVQKYARAVYTQRYVVDNSGFLDFRSVQPGRRPQLGWIGDRKQTDVKNGKGILGPGLMLWFVVPVLGNSILAVSTPSIRTPGCIFLTARRGMTCQSCQSEAFNPIRLKWSIHSCRRGIHWFQYDRNGMVHSIPDILNMRHFIPQTKN